MKKLLVCLFPVFVCCACGLIPHSAPVLTQHDVGNDFEAPAARKPLPLRSVTVSASQVVSGLSMYYRYNAQPTERGVYAYNRWAAPPANLVEEALARLLPIVSEGKCRLDLQISDVILEINRKGFGKVLLAGQASISVDGTNPVFKRVMDVRVPLSRVEPAAEAEGLRDAIVMLADRTDGWVSGNASIAEYCRPL
jgi:hypothetical protein